MCFVSVHVPLFFVDHYTLYITKNLGHTLVISFNCVNFQSNYELSVLSFKFHGLMYAYHSLKPTWFCGNDCIL